MKKIIFILILAVAAMNLYAQIAVDNRGHVAIGHTTPRTNLDMTRYGVPGDSGEVCVKFYSRNPDNYNIAFKCTASGGSGYGCGIVAMVDSVSTGSAIYATTGQYGPYFNYSGIYAGYFNGNVRVTGSTYSNAYLTSSGNIYQNFDPTNPSSGSSTLLSSERGESVSDKLGQVQAVQFLRYDPLKNEEDSKTGTMQNEEKLSAIQYGLNPEQLKEVYPELVYEDEDGNISINYVEMVPLLVQSINELSQELAELKGTTGKKTKAKAKTTAVEETASEVDMVRMDQNKPNPFSESTVITVNIPKNTQKASIFIYDMSGKQVKNLPVGERGETNITVYASNLTAGMYIYTLVVDGKVTVTRKMIVAL